MMPVLAPKDIESLSKLATLLAAPFFSAAMFLDLGLWVLSYDNPPVLGWLVSNSNAGISAAGKAVAFMVSVVVVTIAYAGVNRCLELVPKFMFFFGLTALTFGVLGIGHAISPSPVGAVNVYWHLGALCWGLEIFAQPKEGLNNS